MGPLRGTDTKPLPLQSLVSPTEGCHLPTLLGTLKPTRHVSGCQVPRLQLISLDQHVGIMDSRPVDAWTLGHLQPWDKYW